MKNSLMKGLVCSLVTLAVLGGASSAYAGGGTREYIEKAPREKASREKADKPSKDGCHEFKGKVDLSIGGKGGSVEYSYRSAGCKN